MVDRLFKKLLNLEDLKTAQEEERTISMTKCDFCTKSGPNGKCFWSVQAQRESDCEDAIKRMSKALRGDDDKKKKKKSWF